MPTAPDMMCENEQREVKQARAPGTNSIHENLASDAERAESRAALCNVLVRPESVIIQGFFFFIEKENSTW